MGADLQAGEGYFPDLDAVLDASRWDTPSHPYAIDELWYPLSDSVDHWDEHFHELMLRDRIRMEAFKRAVTEACKRLEALASREPNRIFRILDVGTGVGVWAYLCWKILRGSLKDHVRIYAIEANPQTFERLTKPYLERTLFSHGEELATSPNLIARRCNSFNLVQHIERNRDKFWHFDREAARKGGRGLFDVMICECIGGLVDNEGQTEIVSHAKEQLLRTDAIIIPHSAHLFVTPIMETESDAKSLLQQIEMARYAAQFGLDPSPIKTLTSDYDPNQLFSRSRTPPFDAIVADHKRVGSPVELKKFTFDLDGDEQFKMKEKVRVTAACDRSAKITGLECSMVINMIEESGNAIVLDTRGDIILGHNRDASDCWKRTFLPIDPPVAICKGDELLVMLEVLTEHGISEDSAGPRDRRNPEGVNLGPAVDNGPPVMSDDIRDHRYRWCVKNCSQTNNGLAPIGGGSFSISHSLLHDAHKRWDARRIDLFDYYKSWGLLCDLIVSICVAELFNFLLDIDSLANFFISLGILLTLIRIVHSFRLLSTDLHFEERERHAFLDDSILGKGWRSFSRASLAAVIIFLCFVLHDRQHKIPLTKLFGDHGNDWVIALSPFLMSVGLIFWDISAQKIVNEQVSENDKPSDYWYKVVRRATRLWIAFDITIMIVGLCIIVLAALLGNSNFDHNASIKILLMCAQWFAACVLLLTFCLDYSKNHAFYSQKVRKGEFIH